MTHHPNIRVLSAHLGVDNYEAYSPVRDKAEHDQQNKACYKARLGNGIW